MIDHYQRTPSGRWELETLEGRDAHLHLPSINCTVPLAEVYERIPFSQAERRSDIMMAYKGNAPRIYGTNFNRGELVEMVIERKSLLEMQLVDYHLTGAVRETPILYRKTGGRSANSAGCRLQ